MSSPNTSEKLPHCPRVLSFDGGGVRGLSSLLILRELMEEIGRRKSLHEGVPKPCDYFDLIGGTNSGGLLAIMLGRLRMSVEECIEEYIRLTRAVFLTDQIFGGKIPAGSDTCRFDYKKLESGLQQIIKKRLGDAQAKMHEIASPSCPTFVVATQIHHVNGPPTLFRSYKCQGYSPSPCAIWEAGRATSATPIFFNPIKIDIPPPGGTFVDGGLTYNNPVELALSEANRLWPTSKRFIVVSIGAGRLAAIRLTETEGLQSNGSLRSRLKPLVPDRLRAGLRVPSGIRAMKSIADACVKLSVNTEPAHQRVMRLSVSTDAEKSFPYFRFNVERDLQNVGLEEWEKLEEIAAHTHAYMEEAEREVQKDNCVRLLMNPPPLEVFETGGSSPKHFVMPYQQNPHFTGRDELLSDIHKKLQESKEKPFSHRVAIYGIAGVGKTQVAIEYVYRYRNEYDGVFWIGGSDQAVLVAGFRNIGQKVGILEQDTNLDPDELSQRVLLWLRIQARWLLIIDNLDDLSTASGFLPDTQKGAHILITTRIPDSLNIAAEGIEIPTMTAEDAIELLYLRSDIKRQDDSASIASEIAKELGYLALAIDQAAAYIRTSLKDINKFLPIYHKSRKQLLKKEPINKHNYSTSVATTFILSFTKLSSFDYGTEAIRLLNLFAFLNPDGVLPDFLESGKCGLSADLQELMDDQFVFYEALGSLEHFSLIRRGQQGIIVIHRLVQAVLKDTLSKDQLRENRIEIINVCKAVFPEELTTETRHLIRRFQSQIMEPLVEASDVKLPLAVTVLRMFSEVLSEDAIYSDAERLLNLSLQIAKDLFGERHAETLACMERLSQCHWRQHKTSEAEALEHKIIAIEREMYGEESKTTLGSLNNLGTIYVDLGKFDEAEELFNKVLAIRTRTLGMEHPETMTALNNLCFVAFKRGDLEQAAHWMEIVSENVTNVKGEEDLESFTSMGNLAVIYWQLGKKAEAKTLMGQTLEISRRVLPEQHPAIQAWEQRLESWS